MSTTKWAASVVSGIYEREFDYVWHGLRRLGIPTRDLPDVTHDVFLTLFRVIERYDSARPLRPWLFGIMYRVASDHIRLVRNQRETLDADLITLEPSTSPQVAIDAFDKWRIVERALAGLPLSHRAVLVMHDFLGYTGTEIAGVLDIPEKTVYSRLYHARDRFVEHAEAALARRGGAPEDLGVPGAVIAAALK
ncbi:MAG TPA: RNA polymerase sigma factor [Polyangia bacterium]|nr:RNA polymerase sigma factor [Polyangia bacterium]